MLRVFWGSPSGDWGKTAAAAEGPWSSPSPGALTNASPSRTQRNDQAQAPCIERSIVNCGDRAGEPVKRVVQRFFLFWSSAARNSPACKGKSLRCLRKCRFAYIDTSPALAARRHLTAALHPPRLHLGCQTHQTWCAPGHLGAAPCSAHPIQNFLPGTKVAIVRAIWRMARPRTAPGTECEGCALRSRRLRR